MIDKALYFKQVISCYANADDYWNVTNFLYGMDYACDNELLRGFREWLVIRVNKGSNFSWCAIIFCTEFPEKNFAEHTLDQNSNKVLTGKLFDLLEVFFQYREQHSFEYIHQCYENWLNEQTTHINKQIIVPIWWDYGAEQYLWHSNFTSIDELKTWWLSGVDLFEFEQKVRIHPDFEAVDESHKFYRVIDAKVISLTLISACDASYLIVGKQRIHPNGKAGWLQDSLYGYMRNKELVSF